MFPLPTQGLRPELEQAPIEKFRFTTRTAINFYFLPKIFLRKSRGAFFYSGLRVVKSLMIHTETGLSEAKYGSFLKLIEVL